MKHHKREILIETYQTNDSKRRPRVNNSRRKISSEDPERKIKSESSQAAIPGERLPTEDPKPNSSNRNCMHTCLFPYFVVSLLIIFVVVAQVTLKLCSVLSLLYQTHKGLRSRAITNALASSTNQGVAKALVRDAAKISSASQVELTVHEASRRCMTSSNSGRAD